MTLVASSKLFLLLRAHGTPSVFQLRHEARRYVSNERHHEKKQCTYKVLPKTLRFLSLRTFLCTLGVLEILSIELW